MSGERMYLVESSDEEHIYLKEGGVIIGRQAVVPRSQVASVSRSLSGIRVHTTGGVTYRVIPGFRRKHRDALNEAFAQWGVGF